MGAWAFRWPQGAHCPRGPLGLQLCVQAHVARAWVWGMLLRTAVWLGHLCWAGLAMTQPPHRAILGVSADDRVQEA